MAMMNPLDVMFMIMEAREKPAHVGGMALYEPPPDSPPDFLERMYDGAISSDRPLRPLYLQRPYLPGGIGPWSWREDENFDIEYHVRHSALPHPGRVRELLALVSRLHSSLLDRNRPLWEVHLVEGLADGRFVLYSKIHHAVVDGVSAMRLTTSALSPDPDERDMPYPWEVRDPAASRPDRPSPSLTSQVAGAARAATRLPREVAGAGVTAVRDLVANYNQQAAAMPFDAPETMFNVPITGARRFAAQSWSIDRIRAAGAAYGATLNDMVLAMSAGALRAYLLERDALPDRPLIAMVPVSLRARTGDQSETGNAVGALLCNLGTHVADPQERLALIQDSMNRGKHNFEGLTPLQILMLTALQLAPAALPTLGLGNIAGLDRILPPGFNIVISNVPGARQPLYWNGARLTASYPMSVLVDGQAMNITVTSYAGNLDFGILADRTHVPQMQRMLVHLEDELARLEG
jgi:diacylglycerol O-acyltransferase